MVSQHHQRRTEATKSIKPIYPTLIIRGVNGLPFADSRASECHQLGEGTYEAAIAKWAIPKEFNGLGDFFLTAWACPEHDSLGSTISCSEDLTRNEIISPLYSTSIPAARLREIETIEGSTLDAALRVWHGKIIRQALELPGSVVADDEDDLLRITREWAALDASVTALHPGLGEPVLAGMLPSPPTIPYLSPSIYALCLADIPLVINLAKSLDINVNSEESLRQVSEVSHALWLVNRKPITSEEFALALQLCAISSAEQQRWAKEEGAALEQDEHDGEPKGDPIIARVLASDDLNKYEERLRGSIVDTSESRRIFNYLSSQSIDNAISRSEHHL